MIEKHETKAIQPQTALYITAEPFYYKLVGHMFLYPDTKWTLDSLPPGTFEFFEAEKRSHSIEAHKYMC